MHAYKYGDDGSDFMKFDQVGASSSLSCLPDVVVLILSPSFSVALCLNS